MEMGILWILKKYVKNRYGDFLFCMVTLIMLFNEWFLH
jgi:hypothetical protein